MISGWMSNYDHTITSRHFKASVPAPFQKLLASNRAKRKDGGRTDKGGKNTNFVWEISSTAKEKVNIPLVMHGHNVRNKKDQEIKRRGVSKCHILGMQSPTGSLHWLVFNTFYFQGKWNKEEIDLNRVIVLNSFKYIPTIARYRLWLWDINKWNH